ncbi:xanthine dehydrogenase family protein molybdopterin-binding subunit [Alterisphingorhabdus coralli]|uniref:Molybdopterin cofactor-binding domain-containing protein n=1 Tax=Alterisphingorhabdus coralli TaxID=3071408 RepID=A0AA97FB31_9SPHN|nr:molybdopterin cofactor-binding domain-containing protein [Parasphingorhabdus sp. SCSIO 66989]WOE75805.1 molybdopterin cofactor-binding domain-containing protein [Parasphingorhabdus sp. SCSIO 66989]
MPSITRRQILIGGGVAAGLVVGWAALPTQLANPMQADGDESLFNAYLRIAPSGAVIIAIPQLEMGHGVSTLLAQIVAQELGADWRAVAIEPARPGAIYGNKALIRRWAPVIAPMDSGATLADSEYLVQRYAENTPFMISGDNSALAGYLQPCREAGAAARVMLAQAAAARWETDWELCAVDKGFVRYLGATVNDMEQRLSFAELASEAAAIAPLDILPLRPEPPGENDTMIAEGTRTAFPRLDLPTKVDGSANFAGDIRLPDMLFAAVRHGPPGDSRLLGIQRKRANGITGLVDVVKHKRWVATLASNWWAANKALAAIRPRFATYGPMADDADSEAALEKALRDTSGFRLEKQGDVEEVLEQGEVYRADYSAAAALHAPIETTSATARWSAAGDESGERVEIWYAAQAPHQVAEDVARALDISTSAVTIYAPTSGGSFGARFDSRAAVQAALLARHSKRPVQVIWSRGEDQIQTYPRPAALAQLSAATDRNGTILAWQHKIAAPATGREAMARLLWQSPAHKARQDNAAMHDRSMVAGAIPPYRIPAFAVDHHPADIGYPTGLLRGHADTLNAFFRESFIDELAHRAEREPLSYRMQMLGNAPRLAACLTMVATLSGWDGGTAGSGQGLACHVMDGAMIAMIVRVQRGAEGVRVREISAAVDIGHIINEDIVRQQIESGIIFGMAQALGASSGHAKGLANARRLSDLSLPRLADTPEITISFVDNDQPSTDADALAVPVVAPAIANALFSATNVRFRQLPLI